MSCPALGQAHQDQRCSVFASSLQEASLVGQLIKNLSAMQEESESEVAHSCLTLRDPMSSSLPCFSIHGIFPGKSTGGAAISFSRGSS